MRAILKCTAKVLLFFEICKFFAYIFFKKNYSKVYIYYVYI